MPLILTTGNIFNDPCDAIANPVNTVGVMGAGLAREFRSRYPASYRDYRRLLLSGELAAGRPALSSSDSRRIVLFPTKRHWRDASRLGDVEDGLRFVADRHDEWGIKSLALPALGCGLGGLSTDEVIAAVHGVFAEHPLVVRLYASGRLPTMATA